MTSDSALLVGNIDLRNSQTTYHVEYSTNSAFPADQTASIPADQDSDAGNGRGVSERVVGLTPETTYHFRLIATNQAGTATGDTVTFTTKQAPIPDGPCDNAQYRTGPSANLPDCRAYEMVSPVDKNGGGIRQSSNNIVASIEGDAASFGAFTGFADTIGSGGGGMIQYVASRGAQEWTTHAVTPAPAPDAWQTAFTGLTYVRFFSEDLTRAVVNGYDLPAGDDDLAKDLNIYDLDVASRELRTIGKPAAGVPNPSTFDVASDIPGVSPDGRHLLFESGVNLLPEASGSVRKLYQWDDGALSLAGVLPDGTVPVAGSGQAVRGSATTPCRRTGRGRCSCRLRAAAAVSCTCART